MGRPQPGASEPVMRSRLIVLVTVAALAAAASARRRVPGLALSRRPGRFAGRGGASLTDAGLAVGDTAALVSQLQDRLRADPRDARGYALLGLAYQQRARETGDPTYYPRSERALRRALRLAPADAVSIERARLARALPAPLPGGARCSAAARLRLAPGALARTA